MAFLFGNMVSFSRLSSDGELTAMLAAGYSLKKAIIPVMLLAAVLYSIGTSCAIHLEAWGRREFIQFIYRKTQTEIDNMVRYKIQSGVFLNDFLDYVFYTEEVSENRSRYKNVMLAPRNQKDSDFVIMSPSAQIIGSVSSGDLRMILYDGVSYALNSEKSRYSSLVFKRAEIDILRVFQEKILGDDTAQDDYRSFPLAELKKFIDDLKNKKIAEEPATLLKASFLYHSRVANSFILFAFAFFGMILGIQDQRHGKNRAYIGSVLTIIFCFVTMVGFRWLAEQGHYPTILAAWTPQVFLFLFGLFCFYQKNRLPPSEPLLVWRNMPFRR